MSKAGLRVDRVKVSGGGAMPRTEASRSAVWIHQDGLDNGSVIDYGCGFGKDAETFNWDKYDPYYHDVRSTDKYDTVLCTYVLSAVSRNVRTEIMEKINELLRDDDSVAYLTVPRNIPVEGKLSGYERRPQSYVVFKGLEIIHEVGKEYVIYKYQKGNIYKDKTKEVGVGK